MAATHDHIWSDSIPSALEQVSTWTQWWPSSLSLLGYSEWGGGGMWRCLERRRSQGACRGQKARQRGPHCCQSLTCSRAGCCVWGQKGGETKDCYRAKGQKGQACCQKQSWISWCEGVHSLLNSDFILTLSTYILKANKWKVKSQVVDGLSGGK